MTIPTDTGLLQGLIGSLIPQPGRPAVGDAPREQVPVQTREAVRGLNRIERIDQDKIGRAHV